MALVLKDRVKETSVITGTGSATLLGAPTGYQTFNTAIPTGSTVYYCIAAQDADEWEVGVGTFTAPDTLSRDTIYESSAAGAKVTFTAGTKDVFVTYPAEKAIYEEVNGETLIDGGPITVIGTGVTSIPTLSAELGKFVGNIDLFAQIYNINQNDGANASADFVVYNSNTDVNGLTYFADMGMNSPNYSSVDYPIFTPNSAYYFSYGDGGANTSTLFLGSGDGNVHIFAGGLESNNVVATFDANSNTQFEGNVSLPGSFLANGVSNFGTFVYSGANVAAAANNTVLATKAYVDDVVSAGVHFHEPVLYATAAVLPNSPTYNNGTDGVGATLTAGSNAALVIDGETLTSPTDNGVRVLIKDQASAVQNGVYVVTEAGSGSAAWVLTRSSDADTYEVASSNGLSEGSTFYVEDGSTNAGSTFTCNSQGTITFGTTAISFALVSSALTYTGGTNIDVSGLTISLTGTVAAVNGGTGQNTTTIGDLLYGTTSNTWSKLPLGGAYKALVVNGSGTQVEWNAIALNQSGAVSGALPSTNGGTGQSSYTIGDTLYSSATNTLAKLAGNTTTTKKFLGQTGNGSGSAAPVWEQPAASDITGLAPSATTDTSNASNITSGTLPVARLSGSYTGITGVGTVTAGQWTANTIAVAYGGTGATNSSDARTNLGLTIGANVQAYSLQLSSLAAVSSNGMLARSAANTVTPRTITGSTYVTVTNGDGSAGNPTMALANAVSTNTASTVVVRDAGGNFSAGTITAAFSGSGASLTGIPNSATTANSANSASTIVARDANGSFSANVGAFTTITGAGSGITSLNASNLASGTAPVARLAATGTPSASTFLRGDSSWTAVPSPNNGTLTMNTSGTGLSGSATFTADQSGASTFTVASNATSANTASTIVARDASGNFVAGSGTFNSNIIVGPSVAVDPSSVTAFAAGLITESTTGFSAQGMAFGPSAGQHGAIVYGSNQMYFGTENGSDNTMTSRMTLSSAGALNITGTCTSTGFSGPGGSLTALNASNLSSGTVPDARFPATLPAASGTNLTSLNASNLSSGTVATARLATGTANATTFLRGDSTWATVPSSNITALGLYENNATISANYTIASGNNAISAGPITVNSGVTVTVPSGSTWTVT